MPGTADTTPSADFDIVSPGRFVVDEPIVDLDRVGRAYLRLRFQCQVE